MMTEPSRATEGATATPSLQLALEMFASSTTVTDAREASGPLLTTTGAASAARSEAFRHGLGRLVEIVVGAGGERVQALALAWRLTSVTSMRQHRRFLVDALTTARMSPFQDLPTIMSDPEDRRHFGDAMRVVRGEWRARYLAAAIVSEREGERARLSLSVAYVEEVPVHGDQLVGILEQFRSVRFDQAEPGVGRARRLAAVLDALGLASWQGETDEVPGEAFGKALAELVSWALVRSPIEDRAVASLATKSTFSYLVTIIRLHGTLAADRRTYEVLNPLRRVFAPAGWPDELRDLVGRAASQLGEQLVFLVRLGMPDAELRRTFIALLGEVAGNLRLRRLIDDNPSLTPEGSHWLRTGSARKTLSTQAAIEETAVSAIDHDLALAFREAEAAAATTAAIGDELTGAADFVSPQVGEEARRLLARVDRLANLVGAAARKRGMVLRGDLGSVVPFSPSEHEPLPNAVGERSVRLATRVVERISEGRQIGIVVKADVERP